MNINFFCFSCSPMKGDHEPAATPALEAMRRANKLNESAQSVYDGDMEDVRGEGNYVCVVISNTLD